MIKMIKAMIAVSVILLLAACNSQSGYYPEAENYILTQYYPEAENYILTQEIETESEDNITAIFPEQLPDYLTPIAITPRPEHMLDYYPELPGKIAVITNVWRTDSSPPSNKKLEHRTSCRAVRLGQYDSLCLADAA